MTAPRLFPCVVVALGALALTGGPTAATGKLPAIGQVDGKGGPAQSRVIRTEPPSEIARVSDARAVRGSAARCPFPADFCIFVSQIEAPPPGEVTVEQASSGLVAAELSYRREVGDGWRFKDWRLRIWRESELLVDLLVDGQPPVSTLTRLNPAPAGTREPRPTLPGSSLRVIDLDGDSEPEVFLSYWTPGTGCREGSLIWHYVAADHAIRGMRSRITRRTGSATSGAMESSSSLPSIAASTDLSCLVPHSAPPFASSAGGREGSST